LTVARSERVRGVLTHASCTEISLTVILVA